MSGEKLSQDEIDVLISSFQAGGEEAVEQDSLKKEYREYDFNRPEKFSIDNLQSIERIANTFSKNVSQTLTGRLRAPISVEFASVEQVAFVTDYADTMTKDYYGFFVTNLGHPDLHEIVVEIDLAFIRAIHKRWLGNEFPKTLGDRAPLTDIDLLTAKKLVENIVYENLELAFNSVAPISPSFVLYQTDSTLLKITSGTDMVALVTMNVVYEHWQTTIRLVIPYESVEAVIDKLTVENIMEFSNKKKKKSYREDIEKGLENVEEEVHVTVGETTLTLNELVEIEVGDFLRFDNKVTNSVKGYAAGAYKFDCLIGKDRNRKAFRFLKYKEDERA
ncbi:flagellar motor switch protein FliM [Priestia filamentosa]|uniref:flagellar motor switch protein FliM n=1 Tax=Priestia filamentosa TaxID=1402861 RepID=UPI00397CC1C4